MLAILKALFEAGASIDTMRRDTLFTPVFYGCVQVVELLLERGVSAIAYVSDHSTPMTLAVRSGHPAMAELLQRYGAQPLSPDEVTQLLFVEACYDGDMKKVVHYFKAGADINELDLEHRSVLTEACSLGGPDVAMYLLLNNADPNLPSPDNFFRYPIVAAAIHCSRKYARNDWIRVIRELLDRGAYVSVTDATGNSPLHWACRSNNAELVEMLLKANAKIMQLNDDGETPLDLATSGEVIWLLKAHGAIER